MGKEKMSELALQIAERLADGYEMDTARAAQLAEACDLSIDRSGALLGWVRDYVQERRKQRKVG